jgi:hypothetical protein
MRRLVVLLLTLAAVSASPSQDNWRNLPPTIRKHVHLTSSQLPNFPREADSLRDIRRWPKTLTFEGTTYKLTYEESGYDFIRGGITRLEDLTPGFGSGAYYVHDSEDNPTYGRGPAYHWSKEGILVDRIYSTSTQTQEWLYDQQGRIGQYHVSRPLTENQPYAETLEEFFSRSGGLVAFALRTAKIWYWAGIRTTPQAYRDSLNAWRPVRYGFPPN